MHQKLFLVYFCLPCLLFTACEKKLEQSNCSFAFSIRIDEQTKPETILHDIYAWKKLNVKDLFLELMIKNQNNKPVLDSQFTNTFQQISSIASTHNLNIHVIFSTWNPDELTVAPSLRKAWNIEYQRLIENFLLNAAQLRLCVYGNQFTNIESCDTLYPAWLTNMKKRFPNQKLLYTSNLFTTAACKLHEFSDYVGIYYEPEPLDNHKKQALKLHPMISKHFHNKKIILTHANIYGTNSVLATKNRMRFWSENNLLLLNFNTIYDQSVLTFQGEYFEIKDKAPFEGFIKEYSAQNY